MNVNCRKVEFGKMEQIGDFCFAPDFSYLYLWTPDAKGPDAIRIVRTEAEANTARRWVWDGNTEQPTITPSLLTPEWHGFLERGVLRSC